MKSNRSEFGNGWRLGLAALALFAVALVPALLADDSGQPASGAARLSSVEGQVRILSGDQLLADPAPINSPLFAGTRIETGEDGKAEIQFDDGSVARLSPGSAFTLTAVGGQGSPAGSEIVLEGGLAYFELQGGITGQMRVIFGDSAVTATGFTVLRIRMDTPPGDLAVFSGNAHLDRGNALAVDIHGGETIALNGNDPARYNLTEAIEPDSWDSWNSDRDEALNAESADQTGAAENFVNNQNPSPAWNDLDANGNWYNVPGQGYVWSPYDAANADWDPYGNGNFMWTPGYGYIFISAYNWGYMPYQCGSWNFYGGFGWGWNPGMGGCNPWWRTGRYYGPNIGNRPGGYRPIPMPRNPGRIGRTPPKIVSIHREPFNGGTGGLPPRTRNAPVQIGGATVVPLRPRHDNPRYEQSKSGFVYNRSGNPRYGAGTGQNHGGDSYVHTVNPGSTLRTAPGSRQTYNPPSTPRYTNIPSPNPPVDHSVMPGGGNNGGQYPGRQPGNSDGQRQGRQPGNNDGQNPGNNNGFRAPAGTIAPRGYNGGFNGTAQMPAQPPNNGGNNGNNNGNNEPRFRPTPPPSNPGNNNAAPSNPRPPSNGGNPGNGGGSFQRPSGGNNGGGNNGGGNNGGGAPRGGGSFTPQPTGGGGAPRGGSFTPPPSGGGGGGGQHGGGGGGGSPHGPH